MGFDGGDGALGELLLARRMCLLRRRWLAVGVVSLALAWVSPAMAVCYVDHAASGANNGATWDGAYASLQSALYDGGCLEIWVAKGVYKPAAAGQQDTSFNIRPGAAVYGGFAGTEADRGQRDPAANVTILSGDIDGNDTGIDGIDATSADIVGSNTRHIVVMNGTAGTQVTASTVLDGFTVTGGDDTSDGTGGGALLCLGSGSGNACSPTLSNLVFSGNIAQYGGAIFDAAVHGTSSPALTNVTFSGNRATQSGGGAMYNNGYGVGSISSPTLNNVVFSGNSAFDGGAMFNDGTAGGNSSPSLSNVTFSGQQADYRGGGMFNFAQQGTSSPTLSNVTFSGNGTQLGGGMYNYGELGISSPKLSNVTFSAKSATYGGGGIYNDGSNSGISSPTLNNVTFGGNYSDYGAGAMHDDASADGHSNPALSNVILWDVVTEIINVGGGTANPAFDHSIIKGSGGSGGAWNAGFGTDNGGNLDADPLLAPLGNYGGLTPTLPPGATSPAIDAGTCAGAPATDQRGLARPQGPTCDIGAVEVVHFLPRACRVDVTLLGSRDGTSWDNALDLHTALRDPTCTEIWVAKGVYKPDGSGGVNTSFVITPGHSVYGGFARTESNRDQRDPAANVTILSGDLDNDDTNSDGVVATSDDIVGNNTRHIVIMDGTAGTKMLPDTVLDGFTLTGGDDETSGLVSGGALWCQGSGAGNECSPTLRNLVFSGNRAYVGGAVRLDGSSGGASKAVLINVTFRGNGLVYGSAIMSNGISGTCSPTLSNVTFSGNQANFGTMYNTGTSGISNPTLINVTFSGNSGGAIINTGSSIGMSLSNVILWGDGPEIQNLNGAAAPGIDHSIIQGSRTGGIWDASLGNDNGGNLDADPLLGALANNGGSTPTMQPGPRSAAIDTGTCINAPPADQRGLSRPQGAACDIGAVELRDLIFSDGFNPPGA